MKKLFSFLIFTQILTLSNYVLAEEVQYDNYYVDYVYNNYLKNKEKNKNTIVKPVVEINTTTKTEIYQFQEDDLIQQHIDKQEKDMVENIKIKEVGIKRKNNIVNNYKFYADLGLGLSNFQDYLITQPKYSMDKATMEPEMTNSFLLKFGFKDLLFDNMNLEVEFGEVDNKNITTLGVNSTILVEYNQKIKTTNIGANLTYNFFDIDAKWNPFIGIGIGGARLEIADYGKVLAKDGVPDPSGVLTYFESGVERKNTLYGKAIAGLMYSMSDDTKFSITADYIMYNNFDITYLSFEDLSRLNITAGLRFYF